MVTMVTCKLYYPLMCISRPVMKPVLSCWVNWLPLDKLVCTHPQQFASLVGRVWVTCCQAAGECYVVGVYCWAGLLMSADEHSVTPGGLFLKLYCASYLTLLTHTNALLCLNCQELNFELWTACGVGLVYSCELIGTCIVPTVYGIQNYLLIVMLFYHRLSKSVDYNYSLTF